MEADFNMVNKLFFGRIIIKKYEALHELSTDNEGGEKDCST